ncbi:MAG TPA: acyltransferase, partial [Stenotrophomonas sp.]|nr:acyltransferase [Stenotrophomonas sp.]
MHHQDAATSVAANAHGPYRADIDGLRAIAVVGVLLYHAFPTLLPGGFVGVDVFFVISGFLITRVILDGLDQSRFSIGDFYARRVRRIFPALLLVLA